jgi:ubiquinone/menaquinone biosynthesis C-methylase UbiE
MKDPTRRFSSRVENYALYRPGYPPDLLELLEGECGLIPGSPIADVGSGTGILSELFLRNGNLVYGIEPNPEMRAAGQQLLAKYGSFRSVAGSAEDTTLASQSVDFVTAAQAFHWFDLEKTRKEFSRILRSQGWVVVVWNHRKTRGTPFLEAYEQILKKYGTDYAEVAEKATDPARIRSFFAPAAVKLRTFKNQQMLDWEGLRGRLLSSSYTPEPDHPNYLPMLEELARVFKMHAIAGTVAFEYETEVFFGRLPSAI